MKRKILSLALALMMIISVAAAMPVSAETTVDPIILNAEDKQTDDSTANGYTNAEYYGGVSQSDSIDWDTNGAVRLASSGQYIQFKFNVTTAGIYDLHLAYSNSGAMRFGVTVDNSSTTYIYRCAQSSAATTPDEAECAQLPLTAGEHTIKFSFNTGVFYLFNAKLEYSHATDFIIRPLSEYLTGTLGYTPAATDYTKVPTDVTWAPAGRILFNASSNVSYDVNIFEAGYYDIAFATGKYSSNSSVTVDVYDDENEILADVTVNAGSSDTSVAETVFEKVYFAAGPRTLSLKGISGGGYLYGVKISWSSDQTVPAPEPEPDPEPEPEPDPEPVSNDIILNAEDKQTDDSTANGYTNADYYPGVSQSDSIDWDTNGAVRLASSGQYIQFKFNVTTAGIYDLHLAYSNSAAMRFGVTVDGSPTTYIYRCAQSSAGTTPDEAKCAQLPLTAGEHTIKFSYNTTAFYLFNAKLENSHATDFIIRPLSEYLTGSTLGYTPAATDYTKVPTGVTWAPAGRILFNASSNVSYNVNIFEAGYYDIAFATGKYSSNSSVTVDVYDDENEILADVTVNAGSSDTSVAETVFEKVYFAAGPRTLSLKGISGGGYLYGVKISKSSDQSAPAAEIVLDAIGAECIEKTVNNTYSNWTPSSVAWATKGALEFNDDDHYATFSFTVATEGVYDLYFACASTNAAPTVYVEIDGGSAVLYTLASNSSATDELSAFISSLNLTATTHTITVKGATTNFYLYNARLVENDSLPEANTMRITDVGNNAMDSIAGGARVYAEVALSSASDVELFFVQYAGSGDTKTMVKTSFAESATSVAYTVGSLNFYRVGFTTLAGAGEVKAFLWTTDGKLIPLTATASATVN